MTKPTEPIPVAWMTFTEEGDPDMVFLDRLEACQYCEDDDPPKPLYLAAPPTAQAEGWTKASKQLPPCREDQLEAIGAGGVEPLRSRRCLHQLAEPGVAPEHALKDVRCECCGYMTYHREHIGCIRAALPTAQADNKKKNQL